MKKLILFLFVALFSLGFVACKDDDLSSTYKCNFLGADNKQ